MIVLLIVVALVIAAMIYLDYQPPEAAPPEYDLTSPYLEGLQAATRIQQAAWLAEQQLYTEALRYAALEASSPPPDEIPR